MTIKFYSFGLATLGLVASSLIAISTTAEAPNYSIVYKSDSDRSNLHAFKPDSSIESLRYQEVVTATQDFLDLLNDEQYEAVVLPFNHAYRTRDFCYVLAQCKDDNVGLRMSQLNTTQKIALNKVLMKSYSSAGYSRAVQTMNREGLIEEMENAHRANPEKYRVIGSPQVTDWKPPQYRRGSDFYVAIFGEPAAAENPLLAVPWGIRFEGHHLSLNLTFDGQSTQPEMGTMPMFFGSSPMIVPQSPPTEEGDYIRWQDQEGQQLLHRETWLARSFLRSLDDKVMKDGAWSVLPHAELKGGVDVPLNAASYLEGEKPGIPVNELNTLQKSLLWDYIHEYLQMQPNLEVNEASLRQSLNNFRIWWFGDRDDEHGELYLRVQSDRYLIELLQSNTFGVVSSDVEANHVHISFRDLQNDWDRDSLGHHLQQHHKSPITP